ncbi:FecR domain-containing protein [Niabella aurantiaca]|uniref:FecR domain-containing protein n=1 Tax=Niabella aurantiaca TaxID=379900 RepID=UPI00036F7553|nr:FecR domain-containing protein [Niabella aurantiaca]
MEHKLIAYYEQTLDASERKEVERWLQEEPAHRKIYEQTVRTWQVSGSHMDYTYYNKERAWEKIQAQIAQKGSAGTRSVRMRWWRAGAAAAAVAGLVLLFLLISRPEPLQFAATAEIRKVYLEDSSGIVLYPHAVLKVEHGFNQKNRIVRLEGDALFDIARNPDKPFIIHSRDMDVQVLGTSFTIQQRADFNTVFVHSGKVMATSGDQHITAVARQKIVKDNRTGQLHLGTMGPAIDEVLQTQTIRCKDTRLDDLARILEELYHIEIQLDPAIAGKRITSTYFSYEQPEQAIENVALTINATWQKKGNHYLITK